MTLIAIMFALALERLLSYSPRWRAHDLTGQWMAVLRQKMPEKLRTNEVVLFALFIVPPVFVVQVLNWLLGAQPLGELLQLAFAVAVLLVCLGPRDLAEEIHSYVQSRKEGLLDSAAQQLRALMTGHCRSEVGSPAAAAFVQGHERWLAILLWFFVLGPMGAVLYRVAAAVSCHLRDEADADEMGRWAQSLHGALAWPTSRVAVALYAMAGSSDHALSRWNEWRQTYVGLWFENSWSLLAEVGLASLAKDEPALKRDDVCLQAALSLLNRALLIVLAVVSMFTLGGWLT